MELENCNNILELIEESHLKVPTPSEVILDGFISTEFLNEIKVINSHDNVVLSIDKSFQKLKCAIRDDCDREHCVFIQCLGNNKLKIESVDLPPAPYHNTVFRTIKNVLDAFKEQIALLSNYFVELEKIDRYCSVVEPAKPTFKDDYRKIVLAPRVWLHLEVTGNGCAVNLHLIGNSSCWQQTLQERLPQWDYDKDIVENILWIFDMESFPTTIDNNTSNDNPTTDKEAIEITCSICLCGDLGEGAAPQPLCANEKCGAYFHSGCLYEWLVSSAGGRIPPLGVATGACPSCLTTVSCHL